MDNPKYKYMEIVLIATNEHSLENQVAGKEGTILGMAHENDKWHYAVDIEGEDEVYGIYEDELIYTGKMNKESNFY